MSRSREVYDAIEPRGDLGDIYTLLECDESRPLADETLVDACAVGNEQLRAAWAMRRRMFVTFQADDNVFCRDAFTNTYKPVQYSRPVKGGTQPSYQMFHGEIQKYGVDDYFGDEGSFQRVLFAEVIGHENMLPVEYKVHIAAASDTKLHRTKLHHLEDPSVSFEGAETEVDSDRVDKWNEYVGCFKWWLNFPEGQYMGGQDFLQGLQSMVREKTIDNLDEGITALNLALASSTDLHLVATITGAISLANPQQAATLAPRDMIVEQEVMDVVAFDVRMNKGVVEGELCCYDEKSGRLALVPLNQEQVMISSADTTVE